MLNFSHKADASAKLAALEVEEGNMSPKKLSPKAFFARTATTAESTPPLMPKIAFENPALRTSSCKK